MGKSGRCRVVVKGRPVERLIKDRCLREDEIRVIIEQDGAAVFSTHPDWTTHVQHCERCFDELAWGAETRLKLRNQARCQTYQAFSDEDVEEASPEADFDPLEEGLGLLIRVLKKAVKTSGFTAYQENLSVALGLRRPL